MLPKLFRVKKKKDFEKIYKFGKCVASKYLIMYYVENNLSFQRSAFSISKKVSKKAVCRNKVKRRLSSIFYKKISFIRDSFDFLFIAKKDILNLSYKELENNINMLIKKAGLEKNSC
ncbi:MAG: ribonuclease P protein component [Candidatus Sericytochromatia bacterium]|nr:MAG: ribonuclease P protein component [Candidatus Sericytochromatia bacterium]